MKNCWNIFQLEKNEDSTWIFFSSMVFMYVSASYLYIFLSLAYQIENKLLFFFHWIYYDARK